MEHMTDSQLLLDYFSKTLDVRVMYDYLSREREQNKQEDIKEVPEGTCVRVAS
jgi:hypothetical protein